MTAKTTTSDLTAVEIRQLRESLKLTRRELAAQCGVSHRTVAAWEQGRFTPMKPTMILLRMLRDRADP